MKRSPIVMALFVLASGIVRQLPAQDSPSSGTSSAAVSEALAQKGYGAVSVFWAPGGHMANFVGYPFIDLTIDTATASLLLDTGYSGSFLLNPGFAQVRGVHLIGGRSSVATMRESIGNSLAIIDQTALGPSILRGSDAAISDADDGTGAQGLIGIAALSPLEAIVDFVTDTVYFLSDKPEPPRTQARPRTSAATLREALEAAGQYRTFLGLMQDAGLTSLLEGSAPSAPDSLAWEEFRGRALLEPVVDTMPTGRERVLKLRQIFNDRFRRPGQLTAFVPTDAAFAQLAPDTLRALRADRARLSSVLRGHLLTDTRLDTVAMRAFIRGASQPAGAALWFQKLGSRLDVDRLTSRDDGALVARATIIDPDLTASSGIAHGIDRVLLGPREPVLPVAALAQDGYVGIPLYRRSNGYYVVRGTIDGTPVTLIVDTGAPHNISLDPDTHRNLLGDGKTLVVGSARIPVDRVGGAIDMKPSNAVDKTKDMPPVDGLIGAELLWKLQAYLDYATAMLYVKTTP